MQPLTRNFHLALTFYNLPVSWHEAIRVNKAAEAAMRHFRDALRRGGGPGSTHGAVALLLAAALPFNGKDNSWKSATLPLATGSLTGLPQESKLGAPSTPAREAVKRVAGVFTNGKRRLCGHGEVLREHVA
ncbi:MAG: hypothetical protein H5T86_01525 [Armatimonadetes bacterium]|nr:hypothetical protein [Armatimonadota bacterium]